MWFTLPPDADIPPTHIPPDIFSQIYPLTISPPFLHGVRHFPFHHQLSPIYNIKASTVNEYKIDRAGLWSGGVRISASFQKKSPPRGWVRVRTTCRGSVRVDNTCVLSFKAQLSKAIEQLVVVHVPKILLRSSTGREPQLPRSISTASVECKWILSWTARRSTPRTNP